MKFPGFLKVSRGISLDEPEVIPTTFDALDILTEHTRLHYFRYDGVLIEYIPLTIAEEYEVSEVVKDDNLYPFHLMLAKAEAHKVENAIYAGPGVPDDGFLAYVKNDVCENLPVTVQHEIMAGISTIRNDLITRVSEAFIENREKDAFPGEKGGDAFPRLPSALDQHLSAVMSLTEKGAYDLNTLTGLTRLQYTYITLAQHESYIRQSNDHHHMRKSHK